MSTHRLRAPSEDGALLAVPPLNQARTLVSSNAEVLKHWSYDFQGRRTEQLRPLIRAQVLKGGRDYLRQLGLGSVENVDSQSPWIVTGHQPELYHPGVWIKNFAVAALAKQVRGTGLNLIVDNDLAKSATIRVPESLNGELRVRRVEFDRWAEETPYEDLVVQEEARFASFGERVRDVLSSAIDDPLIETYWPLVLAQRERTNRAGLRFAAARRQLEERWGASNLELPLSSICESDGFLWFVSHILAQLPRFHAVHNEALAAYRARYRIRSRHHPVPELHREGDWREAPFWVWHANEPRRRPLFARQVGKSMELRAGGEARPFLEIPLGPDRDACCAVDQLLSLPARQIRLRTRALTTTMFARLLLGDLFVHGIGGAKYDELGDEMIRGFFGIEPPPYLTLSLTLWIGLGLDPTGAERLQFLNQRLRDLTYNPDRYLKDPNDSEWRAWVAAKQEAIQRNPETPAERLAQFQEIRNLNARLQKGVTQERARRTEEQAKMVSVVGRNLVARNREYSFVLHSEGKLKAAMTDPLGRLEMSG